MFGNNNRQGMQEVGLKYFVPFIPGVHVPAVNLDLSHIMQIVLCLHELRLNILHTPLLSFLEIGHPI
jgi:hypothetical protein